MSRVVQVRVKGAKLVKQLGELHNVHVGDGEPDEAAVASFTSAWPEVDAKNVEVVEEVTG